MSIFKNSPEYEERLKRPFVPPTITLKQVHDAVPKHLLRRDPVKSTYYVVRDLVVCALIFAYGMSIEPLIQSNFGGFLELSSWQVPVAKTLLWLNYWWWQGMSFASFFCIAHELGHQTLYDSRHVNNTLGFLFHTFILAPFFAWKVSHNAHHRAVASMERDENYIPSTRKDYKLPKNATPADYAEMFEETPIYTLSRLIFMQACGWWLYIGLNTLGSPMYPPFTNHFSPYSALFKPEQRGGIIMSDIGIGSMIGLLVYLSKLWGWKTIAAYYFIPYMLCNHWIVMLTYLHHSDPTIPHYRKEEWSYLRGAAATVDRPLMGWMGRFFLHNVSHDHVTHHFFSYVPFYNTPEITKIMKPILKENYNYDSTNTFYALYRSFTQCAFVEEDGNIIFYKNKQGEAARVVDVEAVKKIRESGFKVAEQDKLHAKAE